MTWPEANVWKLAFFSDLFSHGTFRVWLFYLHHRICRSLFFFFLHGGATLHYHNSVISIQIQESTRLRPLQVNIPLSRDETTLALSRDTYFRCATASVDPNTPSTKIMSEPKDDREWTQIIETAQMDVKKSLQEGQTLPQHQFDDPVAKYIDHTQLKLDATESQIDSLCTEARKAGFAVSTHNLKTPPFIVKMSNH